jgi:hypothetical protein
MTHKPSEVSLLLGSVDEPLPPWWLCGIDKREVWVVLVLVCLFTGNFVAPFVLDALQAVSTAMINDPKLDLTVGALANIFSIQLFTSCISLLAASTILHWIQPRGTYLLMLVGLAVPTLLISIIRSRASTDRRSAR